MNAGRRILCFGDSNTWGNIAGTPDRYPADVRWPGVLQRDLGPDFLVIEDRNGHTTVFPTTWKTASAASTISAPSGPQSPLTWWC